MKNLFLDTNVVIDLLTNRQPFANAAAQLFELAEKGKIKLFISALSFSTIYYFVDKHSTHQKAMLLLRELETLMEIIDVTGDVIRKALTSNFKDFEDAIQHHTALSIKKIDVIITRNLKDYRTSELPVLNPDEILSSISIA